MTTIYRIDLTIDDVPYGGSDDTVRARLHSTGGKTTPWINLEDDRGRNNLDKGKTRTYRIHSEPIGTVNGIELDKKGSDGLGLAAIDVYGENEGESWLWRGGAWFERDWLDTPVEHQPGSHRNYGNNTTLYLQPTRGAEPTEAEFADRRKRALQAAKFEMICTRNWCEKNGIDWRKLDDNARNAKYREWSDRAAREAEILSARGRDYHSTYRLSRDPDGTTKPLYIPKEAPGSPMPERPKTDLSRHVGRLMGDAARGDLIQGAHDAGEAAEEVLGFGKKWS